MSSRKVLSAALTAALLFAGARWGSAYVLEGQKWNTPTIHMAVQLGTPSFVLPDGFLSWNADAENALAQWNEQLGRVQFTWEEVPVGTHAANHDGRNEVLFASSAYNYSFGSGVLAVTLLTYSGSTMTETDVLFNPANHFTSGANVDAGKDFHRVALHEFGHVLGLDHVTAKRGQTVESIMFANVSALNHIGADDVAGITALYGAKPNRPPVTGNARLANISTRGHVGTGENVLIPGFIIKDQTKTVLLRALGPTLTDYAVPGALGDPLLDLRNSAGSRIVANDNWKDTQQAQIQPSGLAPKYDVESAILATLPAANYTAVITGKADSSGVALAEVYDRQITSGKLGNISTRGQVSGGQNVLIAGLIINGPQFKTVIFRGLGPGLHGLVSAPLPNPTIQLYNGKQQLMMSNTGWESDALTNFELPANKLTPPSTADSGIYVQLAPGSYTLIVRSATNATGVALAEVYDVD